MVAAAQEAAEKGVETLLDRKLPPEGTVATDARALIRFPQPSKGPSIFFHLFTGETPLLFLQPTTNCVIKHKNDHSVLRTHEETSVPVFLIWQAGSFIRKLKKL